jgi:hypothetical protein
MNLFLINYNQFECCQRERERERERKKTSRPKTFKKETFYKNLSLLLSTAKITFQFYTNIISSF